ncbi:MAG TPA: trypsin-like peptidase domain-containing protein [Pyrinomonadaceae bacterium]|nr:trypsin-like peptidase domain-containing protein [Chloracidobacterium sp.]MBP9936503.1 trypsin-like peptidase domain-containing protein [Pyrinomonadaceae bacterium]MBK9437730.1 trypsin-like peptidase domain-containing protein [Chloracidobacterium sp.]MBK9765871.1 trypsin-like peptidase domain-containing protein [Chloracidobacterium sp.]MBL0239671.1 trypsin-like peptidase domain-containing protein [Chloracidobacterium sp.]
MFVLFASFAGTALAQDFLPELVKRIKPSAVAIETFDAKDNTLARGSGFFIAADRVITNRHVIERAARVEIHLLDGKKYPVRGVLAIDGEGDLALLQVDVPRGQAIPLPIVRAVPQEGESIVVIGNPYGLEGSVSNGIVSAVREISGYGKIIQITASISPGSSGSPVVNMAGQVIGIATLQAAEGQNLNFAVPSERISQLKVSEVQTFSSLASETQKNKRSAAERMYSQGLAQLSRDDFARAAGYFEKAVETDPNYAEAWYQAGYCYGVLGRHTDALRASRQAARLRPEWSATYVNIGASSYALGQFKEAVDAYRQAARFDENDPETQYALGLTLGKLSRTDEEILAYRRAIAIKLDHVNAIERLGVALAKQRRNTEAAAAFEQLKIYRPDAKTYNYLGETYFELGKMDVCIEALNSALGYNPDFQKARYNLGRAYLKSGDRDMAQVQYEILKNSRSDWADRLLVLLNP